MQTRASCSITIHQRRSRNLPSALTRPQKGEVGKLATPANILEKAKRASSLKSEFEPKERNKCKISFLAQLSSVGVSETCRFEYNAWFGIDLCVLRFLFSNNV